MKELVMVMIDGMPGMIGSLLLIALLVIVLAVFFSFVPVGLWISAVASNARVGIFTLIGMRLRRVFLGRGGSRDHRRGWRSCAGRG